MTKRREPPSVFDVELGGEQLAVISLPLDELGLGDLLSPAERAVARDVIAGLSNAKIAAKRKRSARTIANQVASIYRKLGVSSRAELAARLTGR